MKPRLYKNKKGVAPVFAAAFLAILTTAFTSTLLIAINTYGMSVVERMKLEEEKQQEVLRIPNSGAINLTDQASAYVEYLRIDNDGAITVRIRAIYIGGKYVCDPSTFEGDSYINTKSHLLIRFYPNVKVELNQTVLDAVWVITTERGTRVQALGSDLLGLSVGPFTPNPMRLYIGPLMIMFDVFQLDWKSGGGPWKNGWLVPKNTKDVTWRILLSNVGEKVIEVNDQTSFTLISNDNSPSNAIPWYIDPRTSSMSYKPGSFYFVYYSWDRPYSESGVQRQSTNAFGAGTTCINFLLFMGSFVEPNGTRIPFGQTIPFEAVRVTTETMPSSLELVANPENIPNDGVSASILTATVKDANGNPAANSWVDFYTTAGRLSTTHALTDVNGVASVSLISTLHKTTAHIMAICQGIEGAARVVFTPARKVKISAVPTTILKDGATSSILVRLVDGSNANVTQPGILVNVYISGPGPQSKWPILIYNDLIYQLSVLVQTDVNGQARITLQSMSGTGVFTVSAEANGLESSSVDITINK